MIKKGTFILGICVFLIAISLNGKKEKGVIPKDGFVPDKETAIKIAEAIWLPIYGNDIFKEKPYNAKLKDGIWIVTGSLNFGRNKKISGGTAYIEIRKSDCKIIMVTHYK